MKIGTSDSILAVSPLMIIYTRLRLVFPIEGFPAPEFLFAMRKFTLIESC